MSKKIKSRYFTFLLYPDSLEKAGFEEIADVKRAFEAKGLPVAISPLHDRDLNKDGSFKKPHYHVIWIANNPVTADSVRLSVKRLFGQKGDDEGNGKGEDKSKEVDVVSLVQIIKTSVLNTYRYLTHDTPDSIKQGKAKYDAKDIIKINGFDESRYEAQSVEEKTVIRDAILEAILENGLQNMIDFRVWYDSVMGTDYEFGYDLSVIHDVMASNSGLIRMYFDGSYQVSRRGTVDLQTRIEKLEEMNAIRSKD